MTTRPVSLTVVGALTTAAMVGVSAHVSPSPARILTFDGDFSVYRWARNRKHVNLLLVVFATSQRLDSPPSLLCFDPLLAGGGAGLCRPPMFWALGGFPHERDKSGQRGLTILALRSMFSTVDLEDALVREAAAGEHDQPVFHS